MVIVVFLIVFGGGGSGVVAVRTGIQWLLVAESLCSAGYVPKYHIDFTQQVSGLSDLIKVDPPPPPSSLTHMKI